MSNTTFLSQLIDDLLNQFPDSFSEIKIVLPNKRARVFLIEQIQSKINKPIFLPEIISIEELIEKISGLRNVDSLEILFEFYQVYLSLHDKNSEVQDFETFSYWAKTILQDFNEIDRYLLNQNHIFSYLKDVEALKRWNVEPSDKTNLIESTLDFWAKLPLYYSKLHEHLIQKKIGYQGLLYRESILKLEAFSSTITKPNSIIFAGFNALNKAEEQIFQFLSLHNKAQLFWDIDYTILQDSYHDAGMFIRKYKKEWKQINHKPFHWISNHFDQKKNIQIIGTPKTVGQTKIVGNLIEKIKETNPNLQNTAIVLGDENLLLPVLFNLPESVENLNITMGYPSKNNPAQLLITKIFKLHINALQRDTKNYTLYYKDVLDVLSHSLIKPYANLEQLENLIKHNNFTFFSHKKLLQLYEQYDKSVLFDLIFLKWDLLSQNEILNQLGKILLYLKSCLSNESQEEIITKTFLYSIYQSINRLGTFVDQFDSDLSIKGLYAIYKQVVENAEVSFEGKPLSGLQIMGVLESRVLDFENVIITSVNEGKFPSAKSQNSFIPYDIKKEFGLPTYREKDAIYSYHFYHLLFRAKNVYLLYNSDNEGIDAGEKSRFITQLEIDFPNHITKNVIYNPHLPSKAYQPLVIQKTNDIIDCLKEIAINKGFSPSSLTSYIRNPIQFYSQRILRIREVDEVEENIAMNTLGTIIHETLKDLYEPYINQFLNVQSIENMQSLIAEKTIYQFKQVYREGEIKKGKNLLAFEVAKQNVEQLLIQEMKALKAGDVVKILYLEQNLTCELNNKKFSYPIKISGNVDRIELRNGKIRIIDYKSGRVEANSLKINDFVDLTKDIKNEKIIQLLCYALMFLEKEEYKNYEVEAGIISFKNMKEEFMPFGLGKGRGIIPKTIIVDEILESFKEELVLLVNEILNPEIPFEEKN